MCNDLSAVRLCHPQVSKLTHFQINSRIIRANQASGERQLSGLLNAGHLTLTARLHTTLRHIDGADGYLLVRCPALAISSKYSLISLA